MPNSDNIHDELRILAKAICDLVEGGDTDGEAYKDALEVMQKYDFVDEIGYYIHED